VEGFIWLGVALVMDVIGLVIFVKGLVMTFEVMGKLLGA
jgi:hypothetical protein